MYSVVYDTWGEAQIAEEVLKELGIPYRVNRIVKVDLWENEHTRYEVVALVREDTRTGAGRRGK